MWRLGGAGNPYAATLGLRVGPGPTGSGLTFAREVELGSLPLAFHQAIADSARGALARGPAGREVVDCAVTVTRTGYSSPVSTAGDFRGITPPVLRQALREAGTEVLEPVSRFQLTLPADATSGTLSRLVALRGLITESTVRGEWATLGGTLPTAEVRGFEQDCRP